MRIDLLTDVRVEESRRDVNSELGSGFGASGTVCYQLVWRLDECGSAG